MTGAMILAYLDPGEGGSAGLGMLTVALIVAAVVVVLALLVLLFRFFLRSEREARTRRG